MTRGTTIIDSDLSALVWGESKKNLKKKIEYDTIFKAVSAADNFTLICSGKRKEWLKPENWLFSLLSLYGW